MALRIAARFVSRRLSSGGKILSEEEKAAENVYIKKIEQEKLQKLAHKAPKAEEAGSSGVSASGESKASSGAAAASSERVSTDKHRNYAVIAGVVTVFGALGWYLKGTEKKPELQD